MYFHQESFEYENFYSCIAEHEAQYRAQGKRLAKYLFKVGESTGRLVWLSHLFTTYFFFFLLQGFYYANLQPWLKRFPGRVLVLLYDNLRRDPVTSLDMVSPRNGRGSPAGGLIPRLLMNTGAEISGVTAV